VIFTHYCKGGGGVLVGSLKLSDAARSDAVLLVLENILQYHPGIQSNLSAVQQVHDALDATTVIGWKKFKKRDSKDVFCSGSQYSRTAGSRDAWYARVGCLP
jgi:hypothetical protein